MTKFYSYDIMIPFFGLENDSRVKLFLHLLEEKYKISGNLEPILGTEDEFKPENNSNGISILIEWLLFFYNVEFRLMDQTETTFNNTTKYGFKNNVKHAEVLKTIEIIGASSNQFYIKIIQNLLVSLHDVHGVDILNQPLKWKNLQKFTFKNISIAGNIVDDSYINIYTLYQAQNIAPNDIVFDNFVKKHYSGTSVDFSDAGELTKSI